MNILFNLKFLLTLGILVIIIGLSFNSKSGIKVEVKGYVNKPGVYEIYDDLVVEDVINLAGGLKENANIETINLSKKVYDEMVIIISSNEEISDLKNQGTSIKYIEKDCICPRLINDSCITVTPSQDDINLSTKISINNATLEDLITLPGIGEAKARDIIEYRKKNKFKTLEEIMNIKGIGKSIYEKIKDKISL